MIKKRHCYKIKAIDNNGVKKNDNIFIKQLAATDTNTNHDIRWQTY